MPKGVLGQALRDITGLLSDLFAKLSGEDGTEWLEALKKFLRKEETWVLLEHVKTVDIPRLAAFDVATHFRVTPESERRTTEVFIDSISSFAQSLIRGHNSPEPRIAKTTMHAYKMLRRSEDGPIISKLGQKASTWSMIYELLRRQGHGQDGDLLTNGMQNLFYVLDVQGHLWSVGCAWGVNDPHGWSIEAYLVARHQIIWSRDHQVISC